MGGAIHIGTSGWHYKHWKGPFYPEKLPNSKLLDYYSRHFDTVELNNTFYRLPPENGLDNWRDSTPEGFLFAAKGSRFITHMKKLKDPETAIGRYFERVDRLGPKLGPIVFQTPPWWEVNLERLEAFLDGAAGRPPLCLRAAPSVLAHLRGLPHPAAPKRRFLHLRDRRVPLADRDHGGFHLRPPARPRCGVSGQLSGGYPMRVVGPDSVVGARIAGDVRLFR